MSELLPCPFCGGEAELQTDKGPTGELYGWVGCNTCDAMSTHCDLRSMQPEEIHPIDAWNTRQPDQAAMIEGARLMRKQPSKPRTRTMSELKPCPTDCAQCEHLREEIADYIGHRTDNVAGKLWAAQSLFSSFESQLDEMLGEFEGLGHDYYDQSLEIYGAHPDLRLGEEVQRVIRDAGFSKVYVNHGDKSDDYRQETHYDLTDDLPARGWRRRYVSNIYSQHDRVILGEPDPGYYEISFWPESWNDPRSLAQLETGYYKIVPDPLEGQER